ncbi:unnamed protein product [Sphagnum balticum]
MLQCMDCTAGGFAMRINAEKTKVMSVGKGGSQLSANITINGGPVECVDSFNETWNMTHTQQNTLEVAYSNCLRGILGMRVSNQHNLKRIYNTCGAKSLATLMAQSRLLRLGHVARMAGGKYSHIAFFAQIQDAHYGLGQPL